MKLVRIKNKDFTVRFFTAMNLHGIKTIGKARKFLEGHIENGTRVKLRFNHSIAPDRLMKELEEFEAAYK